MRSPLSTPLTSIIHAARPRASSPHTSGLLSTAPTPWNALSADTCNSSSLDMFTPQRGKLLHCHPTVDGSPCFIRFSAAEPDTVFHCVHILITLFALPHTHVCGVLALHC